MWACVRAALLSCIVLALAPEEGRTGTYGGVDKGYEGFRVYLDASVGSLSDPSLEAGELASRQALAEADLRAVEPALLAMYRHFASGAHPYRAVRASLDRTVRQGEQGRAARLVVRLPRPATGDPLGGGEVEVWIMLYLHEDVPEPLAERVAAAFVASQLFGGMLAGSDAAGPLAGTDAAGPLAGNDARGGSLLAGTDPLKAADLAAERQGLALVVRILSGGPAPGLHRLLTHARAHAAGMRALAEAGDPLARALVALGAGQAYPTEIARGLDALGAEEIVPVIRILALLAPDTHREKSIEALAAWHARHPSGAPGLDAWLAALAR
jgi:hypothetical protein